MAQQNRHIEDSEFLEEIAKFAYNCANNHYHPIPVPRVITSFYRPATSTGGADGLGESGHEHCETNTYYKSVCMD